MFPLILVVYLNIIPVQYFWGFFAHRKVNVQAIYCLPAPLFDFYRSHLDYISEHAVDADKRRHSVKGEPECHFIDLDRYGEDTAGIARNLPVRWDSAVTKFGEDSLRKHGIAPYNAYWKYRQLVKAFSETDIEKILKISSDLGHYIGDMHVPLHTTTNYNGQLTGQHGIHGLWESRLPELYYEQFKIKPEPALYVMNAPQFFMDIVLDSHIRVDSVLKLEKSLGLDKFTYEDRGMAVVKQYSKEYAAAYHRLLGNMVEERMEKSAHAIGSIWFSAWIEAGQPNLLTLKSLKLSSGRNKAEKSVKSAERAQNNGSDEHQ